MQAHDYKLLAAFVNSTILISANIVVLVVFAAMVEQVMKCRRN
jgi:hypothetical protein